MNVGTALYLAAAIPTAILRRRRRAWLVPLLAGFVITLGCVEAFGYAPDCACVRGSR